jgi:hypothetical protein
MRVLSETVPAVAVSRPATLRLALHSERMIPITTRQIWEPTVGPR